MGEPEAPAPRGAADVYFLFVAASNLVTALVPSETACLLRPPSRKRNIFKLLGEHRVHELLVDHHELGHEGLEVEDLLGALLDAVLVEGRAGHDLGLELVV